MNNQEYNTNNSIAFKYLNADKINNISNKNLAYLAGLVDSRMSITCTKVKFNYFWRIRFKSEDKPFVKHIWKLLGLGKLNNGQITIGVMEGRSFSEQISKYCVVKRKQLNLLYEYTNKVLTNSCVDNYPKLISELNNNKQCTPHNFNSIDESIGYLSGFFDGRGTISDGKRKTITISCMYNEPLVLINKMMDSTGQWIESKTKNGILYSLRWSSWKHIIYFYSILYSKSKKAHKLYKICEKWAVKNNINLLEYVEKIRNSNLLD